MRYMEFERLRGSVKAILASIWNFEEEYPKSSPTSPKNFDALEKEVLSHVEMISDLLKIS